MRLPPNRLASTVIRAFGFAALLSDRGSSRECGSQVWRWFAWLGQEPPGVCSVGAGSARRHVSLMPRVPRETEGGKAYHFSHKQGSRTLLVIRPPCPGMDDAYSAAAFLMGGSSPNRKMSGSGSNEGF